MNRTTLLKITPFCVWPFVFSAFILNARRNQFWYDKRQKELEDKRERRRRKMVMAFAADEEYRMNPNRPPIYAFEDPLAKIQHERRFGCK